MRKLIIITALTLATINSSHAGSYYPDPYGRSDEDNWTQYQIDRQNQYIAPPPPMVDLNDKNFGLPPLPGF